MKTHFTKVVLASGHEGLGKQLGTPASLARGTSTGATAKQQQETGTAAHCSGGSACVGSQYKMTTNRVGREGKEVMLSICFSQYLRTGL